MGHMMFAMPGVITQQIPQRHFHIVFGMKNFSLPFVDGEITDRRMPAGMEGVEQSDGDIHRDGLHIT